jgi:predicted ester cyclase
MVANQTNPIPEQLHRYNSRCMTRNAQELNAFGASYATAWSSQNAASVAAFFGETASLQINTGAPSVGRTAITAAAQSFMTAFPDMIVSMDELTASESSTVFRWTLVGTNTGPSGTGQRVQISGYEEWKFGEDGLVAESKGHFDEADYQRQLSGQ